jgi:hypothetical protein
MTDEYRQADNYALLERELAEHEAQLAARLAAAERERDMLFETQTMLSSSLEQRDLLRARLAAAERERDRLREACETFRDAVLYGRHQLEEPCLDNDQTIAVLGLFNDTFAASPRPRPATLGGEG